MKIRDRAPVIASSNREAVTGAASRPKHVQQRAPDKLPGLDPELVRRRLKMGRDALKGIESQPIARTPPKYFRTYEQIKAAIADLKAKHPQLVEVLDIGDSYEKANGKADRDLLVMRLTSKKSSGPKPKVFFFGGQHAREIANPELMMRFALWLVEGYGKDPQATAILDTRQIDLMPMMNPDGHAVVERGYSGGADGNLMKRKNTSGKDGQGVDLNRNWATDNWGKFGVSHSPSSDTYCGPTPASEHETKAMQDFIAANKHDMLIDWHSYSELVLYPPDDEKKNTTPDHEHYVRVGKKFASFNGYTPETGVELYPTSGTTTWAYDRYRTPAFCIETGTAFHQTDAQFEENWKKNQPVMIYASMIADDWKKSSAGPEVSDVRVDKRGTARIKALDGVTQVPAVAAELVFSAKTPRGQGVQAIVDGEGFFTLPNFVTRGPRKLVYVRAQDADGNWGPLRATWLAPQPARQLSPGPTTRSIAAR